MMNATKKQFIYRISYSARNDNGEYDLQNVTCEIDLVSVNLIIVYLYEQPHSTFTYTTVLMLGKRFAF